VVPDVLVQDCQWTLNDDAPRPALCGAVCGRRAGARLLPLLAGTSAPVPSRSGLGTEVALGIGHRNQWMLVAFGAAIWMASERAWASFGFTVPHGWRLWTAIAVFLLLAVYHALAIATLARSSAARASLRQQFGPVTAVLPHTQTELYWFGGVSLTAGFCEEFLFRGYFIWVLAPWLGWWGAAALSHLIFTVGHIYQGWAACSAREWSARSSR